MKPKDFPRKYWKTLPRHLERFTPGHRLCAGCGAPIVVQQVLLGTDKPVVACCATGCLEVSSTLYPDTSWNVPYIHSGFVNAASTISGVEAAYRALSAREKINCEICGFPFLLCYIYPTNSPPISLIGPPKDDSAFDDMESYSVRLISL